MKTIKPRQEIFRWSFRKKGKNVINMCSHFFVFSGSLIALMYGAPSAMANPSGGVVVGGSASIVSTPQELQIHQASDRALIEWNNFDINAGETTRFLQPSQTAIALNRVVNSDQISKINGNLLANGRVVIINPNGVLIGATGNVDVASFIATSADISNSDFMNGAPLLTFNRAGSDNALIENNGRITVAETGLAALVAPSVRNNGVINARLSNVQLAGADTFAVDFYGDGLISYSLGTKAGNKKRTLTAENNGSIIADGGTVTMTAADASSVIDSVINNKGTVRAQGLVSRNGEIILTGKGAAVKVSGTLDVTGNTKGGSIKVGGDKQGQGTLAKAATVEISKDAVLTADAGDTGDGGKIIVWSDVATLSRGTYLARGGKYAGNGGFVETSSLGGLDVDGSIVNTLAAFGNAGDWLLDPTNITISTTGSTYVGLPTLGNSTVNVSTINNAMSNVTLSALSDITLNTNVNMLNVGVGFKAFTSLGDIVMNGQSIVTRKGAVTLDAGNDLKITNGRIDTNGAAIDLLAVNNIELTNTTLQSDGKNISLDSRDAILNSLKVSTNGGDFTLTANALLSDLFMDNTTINTTGGNSAGGIKVRQVLTGDVSSSQLGTGNTYSTTPGGKGGKIDIYATVARNSNNNNCLKAGGASGSCAAVADPVALTVTSGGSKTYGDADPAALYATSTALTGDNAFYGSMTRAAGENVGNYAVSRGTLDIMGSTAYAVTYALTNPFVINKAILNILAAAKTKTYGDVDPALTYTQNGLKNGDTSSVITGALTRAAGQNAGTYAITQGTVAASNNYTVNFTGNTLTINKANLTVKADNKTKIYGDNNPLLTTTFTGLKNGDTKSMFNVSTSRVVGEDVGDYAITTTLNAPVSSVMIVPQYAIINGVSTWIGNAAIPTTPFDQRSNYNIMTEKGNFEITRAMLNILADAQTKIYGAADPALTYAQNGLKNGDLASVITGALNRNGGQDVGTYAINQGTVAAGNNYTVNFTGNNLTINKANLTVTANSEQGKVYGSRDPSALTFKTSELFYDDTVSSLLDGTLDRVDGDNVGDYAINQGTLGLLGGNYTLNYVGDKFVITPAMLKIMADARTKIYGENDPRFTFTARGFKYDDNRSNTLTGALARDAGNNVAKYDIKLGSLDAGKNYTIDYTGAKLDITPASLTVTANDQTKVYGANDPRLTFTARGFQYEDNRRNTLTGALTRDVGQNVGEYDITQGNLLAGNNYTVNYVGDVLKITPALLTVTADANQTKIYGAANPSSYTYTATGFKYEDNLAVLSGALNRNAGENVGAYAINKNTLDAGQNYTITYNGDNFNITQKSLLVKADDKTKVYGAADPLLTYTFDGLVNGDTSEDFDISINRNLGENVGNYKIFLSSDRDVRRPLFDEVVAIEDGFNVSNNYSINFENGNFAITKKSLLVKATDKTKVYGSADPLLAYTFDGLEFDDGSEDFDINITRDAGQNVGNYDINLELATNDIGDEGFDFDFPILDLATQTDFIDRPKFEKFTRISDNYEITLDNGNFEITPASLNVFANNNGKRFGQGDPALTFSASGFQFEDSITSTLGGNLVRVTGEGLGTYDITQGELALLSKNYAINFTNGVFTISLPSRTVFPNSPLADVNRPILSVANRIFNSNPLFTQSNLNGANIDVGLLSAGVRTNTVPSATVLANLSPEAGGNDAASVANIEPAAGDDEENNTPLQSSQNNSGDEDIDCANSFLDNKPCGGQGAAN